MSCITTISTMVLYMRCILFTAGCWYNYLGEIIMIDFVHRMKNVYLQAIVMSLCDIERESINMISLVALILLLVLIILTGLYVSIRKTSW